MLLHVLHIYHCAEIYSEIYFEYILRNISHPSNGVFLQKKVYFCTFYWFITVNFNSALFYDSYLRRKNMSAFYLAHFYWLFSKFGHRFHHQQQKYIFRRHNCLFISPHYLSTSFSVIYNYKYLALHKIKYDFCRCIFKSILLSSKKVFSRG